MLRTGLPQQEAQVPPQFYRLLNCKRQIINSRLQNSAGAWFCRVCCSMCELWNIHQATKAFIFKRSLTKALKLLY